jgi:two-component system, response regulator PdtaR
MAIDQENSPENLEVLIVEDELILSLTIERMIERMGHQVIGKAVSGEEAIRKADSLSPDLILMDIRLRGKLDGIDAMNQIRQQNSDVLVIYITGNTDQAYRRKMEKTGFLGVIPKPVQSHDLYRTINVISKMTA